MSLLSKSTVNKILSDDKERRGSFSKPPLAPGEHLLTLSNVELGNSKVSNDAKIALTYSGDAEHAPKTEHFMLSGSGREVGLQKIVTFMANSFKHEMEECADEKELLTQLLKFKGKKFKAAVKIGERLYKFVDSAGKDGIAITKEAKIWYTGTADDTNFKVNPAKAFTPLSSEDKAAYLKFKEEHPDTGNASGEAAKPAETEKEEQDDLPF